MIPRLLEGEKGDYFDLKIDEEEVSWIASSCLVGSYLIIFISNPISIRWGKRKTMLFDILVFLVGTLVNILSKGTIMLCIGRLLMGIVKDKLEDMDVSLIFCHRPKVGHDFHKVTGGPI